MKIVFLGDGRSVHIQRWMDFFKRQNDRTYLVTLEEPVTQSTETIKIKPRVRWNLAKYLLSASQIKEVVRRINPDLVNAHFVPNYGLIGAWLKIRPLVISAWGSDILVSAQKSFLHKSRANWVLKKADWLTSDSFYLTEEMVKLGADSDKISTFALGVEEDILPPAPRKLSGQDTLTVISIRQLEPIYNLDLLIHAIPLIFRQSAQKLRFIIVGEGSQKKRLQQMVVQNGCFDKVEFRGKLSRLGLIDLLSSSDVYVSTSLSDSTSVSLLEAFACGLVPVVTDIPGNREWIKDGENGYLIPVDRPEILAQKILQVCQNLPARQDFVDRNLEIVREKADYRKNLILLRDKFEEIIWKAKSNNGG